jgi:hypothetical protein
MVFFPSTSFSQSTYTNIECALPCAHARAHGCTVAKHTRSIRLTFTCIGPAMHACPRCPMCTGHHRATFTRTACTTDCHIASAASAALDPPLAYQPTQRYEARQQMLNILTGDVEGVDIELELSIRPATRGQTGGQDQEDPLSQDIEMGRSRHSGGSKGGKEGDLALQNAAGAVNTPERSYAPHEALAGRPPCCW